MKVYCRLLNFKIYDNHERSEIKAYGLQQRSTRHTYQRVFLKNKICSFF